MCECREDFTAYADVCFREFGDRVLYWSTVNEVNVFAIGAYDQGIMAPFRCSPPFGLQNCTGGNSTSEPYIVAHNIMLAHATTVRLYRNKYQVSLSYFIHITIKKLQRFVRNGTIFIKFFPIPKDMIIQLFSFVNMMDLIDFFNV